MGWSQINKLPLETRQAIERIIVEHEFHISKARAQIVERGIAAVSYEALNRYAKELKKRLRNLELLERLHKLDQVLE